MLTTLDDATCLAAIRAGWLYLQTRMAACTGSSGPLFRTEVWRDAITALDTAALARDLAATQAQCRVLWGLALATPKLDTPQEDVA
jgi:hypothetical protein